MLVTLSALLFSLVALELSATAMKSTEEGHNAFLISRLQSSEPLELAERLRPLLAARASRSIRTLLVEAGILGQIRKDLENLKDLEISLSQDLEHYYNLILYYLPDDLKKFFGTSRIFWDVENLKQLYWHFWCRKDSEPPAPMTGPFGHLGLESIAILAKSTSPEELIKNSKELLPTEFSSKFSLEEWSSPNEFEFSLDLAAFEYLRQNMEETRTRRTRLVWDLMTSLYEIQNVLTIARLKLSKVQCEEISRFMFPAVKRLDKSEIGRLLEAEDYMAFLQALKHTRYGKYIPDGTIDPAALEDYLEKASIDVGLEMLQPEMARIIQFLAKLEEQYGTIRKAGFLVYVKAHDEE
jgi:vacuolar-type H+-ATPase subunit C/Vma6